MATRCCGYPAYGEANKKIKYLTISLWARDFYLFDFFVQMEQVNLTAGGELMSSFIALITSLCSTTESRAQPLCARVTSCLMAVRKPWGLKKPLIQNTFWRPLKIQFENWLFLSRNSVNQKPMVEDSHEIWKIAEKGQNKKKRTYISTINGFAKWNRNSWCRFQGKDTSFAANLVTINAKIHIIIN